jgi:hypothetical protein
MFNGGRREAGTQSANMPDDNPKAFKLLLGWVYVGKIEVPAESQGLVDPKQRPACNHHQHAGTEACPYAKK